MMWERSKRMENSHSVATVHSIFVSRFASAQLIDRLQRRKLRLTRSTFVFSRIDVACAGIGHGDLHCTVCSALSGGFALAAYVMLERPRADRI